MAISTRAVVLGGGLTGMLAAAALAAHVDEVLIVERDQLPDGPQPRTGLPRSCLRRRFVPKVPPSAA